MTQIELARVIAKDEDRCARAVIILSRNGEFTPNDKKFGESLHNNLVVRGYLSEKQMRAARNMIIPKYIPTLRELLTRNEGC